MKMANKIQKIFPAILILPLILGVISNLFNITSGMSGLITVAMTAILMIVGKWAHPKVNQLSQRQVSYLIGVGLIIIFIVQLWVLNNLQTTVYNDPFRVLYKAEELSHGHHNWAEYTYFWRYPNNVNIAYILSRWLVLTNMFHLSTNTAVHILTIFTLDTFILISLKTVQKLNQRAFATMALLLFYLVSPFAYTYYLQVFYSDLPTLLALMIAFWVLINWSNWSKLTKSLSGIGLLMVVLFSQLLKPTLILMVIAMAIVAVIWGFSDKQALKKVALPFAIITLGILLAVPTGKLITKQSQFTPNERYQMPVANWIYMSYNSHSHGIYNSKDVQFMNTLPNMKARQRYLKTALPKRLKQLGPLGIVKQWGTKAVILLNGGQVSSRYNRGYVNAPKLYQRFERIITIFGNSLLQAGFALIYLVGIIRCWQLMKSSQSINIVVGTAIVLALGYISFHTLVWESECRYGQAIFPLLLVLESWPLAPIETFTNKTRQLWLAGITIVVGVLGNIIPNLNGLALAQKTQTVAIQRGQLSVQYGVKSKLLDGNTTATQRVDLNHASNHFQVQTMEHTKLKYKLVNIDTRQAYSLQQQTTIAKYTGKLIAGRYQIEATNPTSMPQPISLTFTQNYQMAPYPVRLNGRWYAHGSFIYRGLNHASY